VGVCCDTGFCVLHGMPSHGAELGLACSFAVVAGGDNGVGAMIWRSTDKGQTWDVATLSSKPLMLMAAGAGGSDAVASGFVSVVHSSDSGSDFAKSTGLGATGPCQSAEAFKGVSGAFGVTGDAILFNGVSVSTDGGASFTAHSVWGANSTFSARYGAFPSADTWFVSAGTWPSNNNVEYGEIEISERIRVNGFKRQSRFVSNAEATVRNGSCTSGWLLWCPACAVLRCTCLGGAFHVCYVNASHPSCPCACVVLTPLVVRDRCCPTRRRGHCQDVGRRQDLPDRVHQLRQLLLQRHRLLG